MSLESDTHPHQSSNWETAGFKSNSPTQLLPVLLQQCIDRAASDLHLSTGEPPFIRRRGRLIRGSWDGVLTESQMSDIVAELIGPNIKSKLAEKGAVDGSVTSQGVRFRYNIYQRQSELAVAIRRLEDRIRPLSELGLPDSLYELADLRDGLVVISGPTGSGKSTTLATLIDRVNQRQQSHIITIEDPIEYLHPSKQSLVNQRQLGVDCPSFGDALVSSLRQDPDVILVGEIREIETIRIALAAAETGHLVFTTVHAGDSVGVIERITSVFPAEEQAGVRQQLALVMRACVSQRLVIADGPAVVADERRGTEDVRRRVVASEVLRVNSAIANLMANGKSRQIYSAIEAGTGGGMQTMDQDLARLMAAGMISERTAMAYAHNFAVVMDRFERLRRGGRR